MKTIKPFRYIPQLDCVVVAQEFAEVADRLGLLEWSPVVFLGRLFARDNDFGEHWFDNWAEREELAEKAREFGIENSTELLILVPQRFSDGLDENSPQHWTEKRKADGPCHSPSLRKQFWTDVLKSLELSYEFFAAEAEYNLNQLEVLYQRHPEMMETSPVDVKRIRQEIQKLKPEIT